MKHFRPGTDEPEAILKGRFVRAEYDSLDVVSRSDGIEPGGARFVHWISDQPKDVNIVEAHVGETFHDGDGQID
jgi:hypothetical protein